MKPHTSDDLLQASLTHDGRIKTFTGKMISPTDLRVEDVDIRDIAHGLAMACRFNGHTRRHYSVAEHSIHVAGLVPRNHQLEALLHDASEAYLVDLPKPVKVQPQFSPFVEVENRVMEVIRQRFNLEPAEPELVRYADKKMCLIEKKALMGWTPPNDEDSLNRFGFIVPNMNLPMYNSTRHDLHGMKSAEMTFLRMFFHLSSDQSRK
jgi:uncharacterized protein